MTMLYPWWLQPPEAPSIRQIFSHQRLYLTVLNLDFDKVSSVNDKATVVEKFYQRD